MHEGYTGTHESREERVHAQTLCMCTIPFRAKTCSDKTLLTKVETHTYALAGGNRFLNVGERFVYRINDVEEFHVLLTDSAVLLE